MSLNFSTGASNALLDGGLDAPFNSGVLELRTGAKPASADNTASGTLLASIALPADVFAAAASRSKVLNTALTGVGAAGAGAGTAAAHFRLRESADTGGASTAFKRIDGDVSGTGGSGDLKLDNVSIATSQAITIATLTLTGP